MTLISEPNFLTHKTEEENACFRVMRININPVEIVKCGRKCKNKGLEILPECVLNIMSHLVWRVKMHKEAMKLER